MLGVLIILAQVLADPQWRNLFTDFAPWVLEPGLTRCFSLHCGRIGYLYRERHGLTCLFSQAESAKLQGAADLITCKFCQRDPYARWTGEEWETKYSPANPWRNDERNAFQDMRRMFRENRSALEFGSTQAFQILLRIYPQRQQQPRDDMVPRAQFVAVIRERDAACRERDAAQAELAELKSSLRLLLDKGTSTSITRSRSPRGRMQI